MITELASVTLDEARNNRVVRIHDISDVIIVHSDGAEESLGVGGYLDIGLHDTMKDLLVNLVGAVVFSIVGFVYVKQRGKGKFAARFIPQVIMENMEDSQTESEEGIE